MRPRGSVMKRKIVGGAILGRGGEAGSPPEKVGGFICKTFRSFAIPENVRATGHYIRPGSN